MTAEEKAKELVNKYGTYVVMWTGGVQVERANVKQCALIAVDEIIAELQQLRKPDYTTFIQQGEMEPCDGYEKIAYWRQVREQINKL